MTVVNIERIAEIREKLAAIQPVDEHVKRSRYDHGGGRMYREQGERRSLILDAYEEGDREFYFHAAEFVRDLLTQVDALTATLAHLTQERDELLREVQVQRGTATLARAHMSQAERGEALADLLLAEQKVRAEQAEATLARVKALSPQWRKEADRDHDDYASNARTNCADELDAALVDPPVSSSTETT